jgi:hypothetical protein
LLRATLEKRLGAGAAGPAALFDARSIVCCARRLRVAWVRVLLVPQHCLLRATLAQRKWAGAALESRSGARVASPAALCAMRRLRSAWVRELLVPQHCLLRATLKSRLGAVAAGPAPLFAARDASAAQVGGCGAGKSLWCTCCCCPQEEGCPQEESFR